MLTIDPLQPALDSFRRDWENRVGEVIAKMIAGDIEDLRASGLLDHAAEAGDAWPNASLLDAHARPFDLAGLVSRGPAIVSFYRGGWCPYCNLELRAWQNQLEEIRALGGTLVAISPELPDASLSTAEKNALAFPVLSDFGSELAAALGIRFSLSDKMRPFYERAGHDLPKRHGDGRWTLPMPATFVLEQGGRIASAFIEPDYRKRLDPAEAMAVLRALPDAKAA